MIMNRRNKCGPALRRAIHKFKRSRIAHAVFTISIIMVLALVFISISSALSVAKTHENEQNTSENEQKIMEPEPLVIEIPEPCEYGSVIVFDGEDVVFDYFGNVEIRNDGKNGKNVDIRIHDPEIRWPCSCAGQ